MLRPHSLLTGIYCLEIFPACAFIVYETTTLYFPSLSQLSFSILCHPCWCWTTGVNLLMIVLGEFFTIAKLESMVSCSWRRFQLSFDTVASSWLIRSSTNTNIFCCVLSCIDTLSSNVDIVFCAMSLLSAFAASYYRAMPTVYSRIGKRINASFFCLCSLLVGGYYSTVQQQPTHTSTAMRCRGRWPGKFLRQRSRFYHDLVKM
jgi:hypothetical protein